MLVRGVAVMGLALGLAGQASGADLASAGAGRGTIVIVEPTALEWLRYVHPRVGRNVVVAGAGVRVPAIEWRHPVEVRVRTESGAALTEPERAAIRDLALVCRRGDVRNATEHTEMNGTFVIEYDCAWLQGFDGR